MGCKHGFHSVCNQLAAGQRVAHADVTHRNTIIDADGVELKRYAACLADRFLYHFAEILQVHVPGNDVYIRVTYGDKRFVHIFIAHPGGSEQTAMRRSVGACLDPVATHRTNRTHDDIPPNLRSPLLRQYLFGPLSQLLGFTRRCKRSEVYDYRPLLFHGGHKSAQPLACTKE